MPVWFTWTLYWCTPVIQNQTINRYSTQVFTLLREEVCTWNGNLCKIWWYLTSCVTGFARIASPILWGCFRNVEIGQCFSWYQLTILVPLVCWWRVALGLTGEIYGLNKLCSYILWWPGDAWLSGTCYINCKEVQNLVVNTDCTSRVCFTLYLFHCSHCQCTLKCTNIHNDPQDPHVPPCWHG